MIQYSNVRTFCITVLNFTLLTFLLCPIHVHAVIVTEVNVLSLKSGRTDYVIAGESVQLSCHYVLTDPYERVTAVSWKKDDQDVSFNLLAFTQFSYLFSSFDRFTFPDPISGQLHSQYSWDTWITIPMIY